MKTLRRILGDGALLIARVAIGAAMMVRGWFRIMGEGGMDAQITYLTDRQVPLAEYFAWGATVFEIGGGLFLVFGLLTPLVGALLAVEQVLVILWTNWFNGFGGGPNGPGFETNLGQLGLGLVFGAFGGGRLAMDQLFKRPDEGPAPRRGVDDAEEERTSVRALLGDEE